jgi:hypothetical protein
MDMMDLIGTESFVPAWADAASNEIGYGVDHCMTIREAVGIQGESAITGDGTVRCGTYLSLLKNLVHLFQLKVWLSGCSVKYKF